MAQTMVDAILEVGSSLATPIEHSNAIPIEEPRNKSRTKFMQGIQRISSSSSITNMGRRRAISNPYSGRGSLSCVSLSGESVGSPRVFDNSYSSQASGGGYSTASTSAPGSPGCTPFLDNLPNRRVGKSVFSTALSSPTCALPIDMRPSSRNGFSSSSVIPELVEDYFALPVAITKRELDFWGEMPHEIKLSIFAYLQPKEIVRASIVSKDFYKTCFDGQLWTRFDASEFYKDIPAESLAKIIVAAGPFVKDLNLRGCVQVEHYKRAEVIVKACKNLVNATLEGCRNFQRSTLHNLLKSNERLASLNLTGLTSVTNGTCKIIAQSCPSLEIFNISWCTHMDARGLRSVVLGCPKLKDLRAGEVRGFNTVELAQDLFETNNLERLVLTGCTDITDEFLKTMISGTDPEIDLLTDLPMVPVRKLRHLDLTRCHRLRDAGVKSLANFVPDLEGLQLNGCTSLTDASLSGIIDTTPRLTHLDLEEIGDLTNSLFTETLAKAPCAPILQHLSISYCENIGDTGMLPVLRVCTNLQSIDMDNTKISDLCLAEAASMVRTRSSRTTNSASRPRVGLRMVVFDCQNITWTGIREVLSRNSEVRKPTTTQIATYPTEIISMKCFYGWQMTVEEHTRRVLKGDLPGAGRLERKWTTWMIASEEAGAEGAGIRRRRRRAREAQMLHADEEEGGVGMDGIGRRRRARSSGCALM